MFRISKYPAGDSGREGIHGGRSYRQDREAVQGMRKNRFVCVAVLLSVCLLLPAAALAQSLLWPGPQTWGKQKKPKDSTPPVTTLLQPPDGAVAHVGSDIAIRITDDQSGVDPDPEVSVKSRRLLSHGQWTTIEGHMRRVCTDDGLRCSIIFLPKWDLPINHEFLVTVKASDKAGNTITTAPPMSFSTQILTYSPTDDDDGDGVSTTWESRLGTDPAKRTLFVKPRYKLKPTTAEIYWADFKLQYRDPIQAYFDAHFRAKTGVGLEIRVIGDPENPYCHCGSGGSAVSHGNPDNPTTPFKASCMRNPKYDPALDTYYGSTDKPPVNIITIQARGDTQCVPNRGSYEVLSTGKYGHISLKTTFIQPDPDSPYWANCGPAGTCSTRGCICYATWTWDTKGATTRVSDSQNPNRYDGTTANRIGYHGPVYVGLHALACYFEEGVYESLAAGSPSCNSVTNCYPLRTSPCCTPSKWSTDDYNRNGLVDFNEYTLDSTGKITAAGATNVSGEEYDRATVLKHTLVHEIIHALLRTNAAYDECSNPCCPMGGHVARERGWTLTAPGASSCANGSVTGMSCTHGAVGDVNDITRYGVIWNLAH